MKLTGALGFVVSGAIAAACGSTGTDAPPGGFIEFGPSSPTPAPDRDPQPPMSPGADASTTPPPPTPPPAKYPAFMPDIAQLVNRGGPILKTPRLVTITWDGDPNAPTVEAFADKLGASSYWAQTVSEYGVGPTVSNASLHVHLPAPAPATIPDDQIETFITDHLSNPAASGWPAPDPSTVYLLYLPLTTMITTNGTDACVDLQGYHGEVRIGTNAHVAYAVIIENCHGTQDVAEFTTQLASHEIAEASTDPHTNTDNGLLGFDRDHLAWELFNDYQDENGDACELYESSYYREEGSFPFGVQRLWSNASAAAGHNPCVPLPAEPYFNVTALATEDLTVTLTTGKGAKPTKTRGIHVPVGQSKSFQVGYHSDAKVAGGWNLEAVEGDGGTPPTPSHLSFEIDKRSGDNGDIANVTVTVNAAAAKGNAILMTLKSTKEGFATHYNPILIGAY